MTAGQTGQSGTNSFCPATAYPTGQGSSGTDGTTPYRGVPVVPALVGRLDLTKPDVGQSISENRSRCFPWWSHLHPIYSEPLAAIDRRTPCRDQRCEVTAGSGGASRLRQWGKVAAPTDFGPPAASLGRTMVQAAADYGRPLHLVRQVYILGRDECSAPIGRRDFWGVFYADPKALKAVLADADAQRAVAAMETRLARRIAARMAKFGKTERQVNV